MTGKKLNMDHPLCINRVKAIVLHECEFILPKDGELLSMYELSFIPEKY